MIRAIGDSRMAGKRYPFVRVSGSHHEIGYQLGKKCGDKIRRFNEIILGNPTGLAYASTRIPLEEAKRRVRAFIPAFERYCPHLLEEIRSIAEGAEMSLEEAMLPNVRSGILRVQGCTAFALSGKVTADGKILAGQNSDIHPDLGDVGIVLNIIPDEGPQILMWTFAGLIGYHGMNHLGVSHFANSLPAPSPGFDLHPKGKLGPGYMAKRLMLEKGTMEEILNIYDTMGIYGTGNYVLTDSKGRIADVELYTEGYEVLGDNGLGYIVHTNHYLAKKLEYLNKYGVEQWSIDSTQRLKRFDELLKKERGNITVDKLKEFLSDHSNYPYSICRHDHGELSTTASIISEPESHCIQVAAGNPCKGRYYTYEMEYPA